MDFDDVQNGYDELFEITIEGNLQYPSVAAQGDNLVILAETDKNGNKDIICIYSDEGINNLKTSFIADSNEDECYPDIRHKKGDIFICTFVKNNNLYASVTQDGGATWSTPQKINENNNSVVEEYKTSDLCEKATKVMWEELHDNIDIYVDYLSNPPSPPIINGPIHGKVEVEYTYTFNSTDYNGDYCVCIVNWGDDSPIETVNPIWYNPEESGPGIANHSWDTKGTYVINARAIDIYGGVSDWGTLTVTMKRNKAISNSFFSQFLERFPMLKQLFSLL